MRIALDQHEGVGLRAGRILMAEPALEALGIFKTPAKAAGGKLVQITTLAVFDTIASDRSDGLDRIVRDAVDAGINCVLWSDGAELDPSYGKAFEEIDRTLVTGANLASGLAPSLASHEMARGGQVLEVTVAWTEPGAPLRRGEAIPFPDPVGAQWAKEQATDPGYHALVAPVRGDWAGGMARVTSAADGGVVTRVVGVADQAAHLEAISLAAAVVAVASYPPGAHRPAFAAEPYLAAALGIGLDVAAYTSVE